MKNKQDSTTLFYQNLGELFYAIANADGVVEATEIETLKMVVKQAWLHSNNANIIVAMFDWLHDTKAHEAEVCFDNFLSYMTTNKVLFTPKTKALVLQTANAIASRFSGRNKSELILLAKLDIELKKI